jgi:hypothetical protein
LALLDENGGDGRGQKRTVTAVAPAPAVDPTFNEPWGLVAMTTLVTIDPADSTAAAPHSHHCIDVSRRSLLRAR